MRACAHLTRVGLRARQRGITLVLLLALVMMGALYMLLSQLGRAAQRVDRDAVTMSALGEAKQALIGHAARERRLRPLTPTNASPPYFDGTTIDSYGTSGLNIEVSDRPGSLPCPAPDEDGIALPADTCASWSTAGSGVWKNRVGWLPWRTLGIPPLRDADGNLLWYAVSDSARNGNLASSGPPLILNSDSVHRAPPDPFAFRPLTVQGTVPAQNVVAVVIAPGQALPGQDRVGARYSVRSWLEGRNNYLDNDAGAVSDDVFEMQNPSPTFNDTLVSITATELFSVVENAVALRAQRTIVPLLQDYYASWDAQPYPAAFDADKTRTDFTGTVPAVLPVTATSVIAGHLPLLRTDDVAWGTVTIKQLVNPAYGGYDPAIHEQDASVPLWQGPDNGHVISFGAPSASACTPTAIANAPDTLDCTVYYTGRPWVKIYATIPVGARGLVKAQIDDELPTPLTSALSGTAGQDGSTTMVYRARLNDASSSTALQFSAFPTIKLDSPGTDTAWFIRNEWYRLVQYAVAPGAAPGKPTSGPGAVADCTSGTTATCLDARHANGTIDFSRAVLVLAGSSAFKAGPTAQLRQDDAGAATTDLANYFEAGNLTANLQYEEKRRSSQPASAFNDRLAAYKAP
jgi:type II secretory pathway pseudopilin PulG